LESIEQLHLSRNSHLQSFAGINHIVVQSISRLGSYSGVLLGRPPGS